ncbi:MAG: CHASE4 domain-containing protein, partial [Methanoregula sp.]|nr:CHASE4 domain-containing protein [Methanoregula sp.]
ISQFFILNTFADIEKNQATADMQRVLTRLDDQVEDVAAVCRQWAQWDDTYSFVNDLNPAYIDANLVEPALFRNMKINYVLFYNSTGKLVYSRGYNPEDGTNRVAPEELRTIISNSIVSDSFPSGISGRRGYSLLNREPVIIAGYHITSSNQQELSRGTLVMVRQLSARRINELARQTEMEITLSQVPHTAGPGSFSKAERAKIEGGAILLSPVNDTVIQGSTMITGIENTPTKILVMVDFSRPVFRQVQLSIAYIMGVIIILAFVLIIVIRWPLKKFIVNPIISLDADMLDIAKSGNVFRQITGQGDDEIRSLAGSLNHMLEEINSAQQQIRESESRFRALAENTPDIIFSADLDGIFLYITPQVEKYGFPVDEVVGKRVFDFVFPDDRSVVLEMFAKVIKDGHGTAVSFRILDTWQNIHWLEANSTAILDTSGKCIGLQGMIRDITDRRQALDAITLANKKLNLMYDITRHDILNKITILFGLIDMTKASSSPDEREQFLLEINDAGQAIYQQIALTRDYQEVGIKNPQWNSMKEVFSSAFSNFSGNPVRFVSDIESLEIYADPLIEKVIYNLVDNAIRYGKKITTISFSVQISDKGLELICADDGIGIDAGLKEKIFERGFGNNTGLGLFLTREILMITGITIREAGEPGNGARFVIYLPKGTYRFVER